MLRSLSLQLLFTDRPFPDRARAAAAAGFDLVDLWDWRDSDVEAVAAAARDVGIGINGFFGVRDTSLVDPAQRHAFLEELRRSLEVARRVGARQLHVFSNAIRPGGVVVPAPAASAAVHEAVCLEGLAEAVEIVRGSGVVLALEHLNPVFLPGYLWTDVAQTVSLARQLAAPDVVGVVLDFFHQQLSGGRLSAALEAALPHLVRVDVAEVPGRHEPGAGEIDFAYLRRRLEQAGYDGTISFEVVPSDGRPETALRAIEEVFPASRARRGVEAG